MKPEKRCKHASTQPPWRHQNIRHSVFSRDCSVRDVGQRRICLSQFHSSKWLFYCIVLMSWLHAERWWRHRRDLNICYNVVHTTYLLTKLLYLKQWRHEWQNTWYWYQFSLALGHRYRGRYMRTSFTRGLQVKLWDSLRRRAVPGRFRGVFTTRRYTNLPLPLPLSFSGFFHVEWPSYGEV